ncbi:hypothetical protein PIB30_013384 [Stylosanthes scabra]|uniref:Uncharacterized protein n=1 Tax=Stylosanthes scabra TaxID=79078 RepID=A0ABU6W5S2_9FABA|nr:hypothetical protein [Stylosanthes scabra]
MRRSNRLRAGKCSLSSAAPQQVEIVDIEDDLADFPSETTPNPIASPPRIPESHPCLFQRTPKGRVKKRARRTMLKKTTTTIPENHAETEPDTQNEPLTQPPIDNVPEMENLVENHDSGPLTQPL